MTKSSLGKPSPGPARHDVDVEADWRAELRTVMMVAKRELLRLFVLPVACWQVWYFHWRSY